MAAKYFSIGLLALSLVACALASPLVHGEFAVGFEDEYIVQFRESTPVHTHSNIVEKWGLRPHQHLNSFHFSSFSALHVKLDKEAAEELAKDHSVKSVSKNDLVQTYGEICYRQRQAPWGLNRIGETELVLDGDFVHDETWGLGVTVYVIDTGIYIKHREFIGRARYGFTTFPNETNGFPDDCNGHGTHVAGTIGGTTVGIARNASLVAVKVLGCDGRGTVAQIISGLQWTVQDYMKLKKKSVINMSVGAARSPALDAATVAAHDAGITVVVAAGNENKDACDASPAGVPQAITVGSTSISANGVDQEDARSDFSNWGKCVDLLAPGSLIDSAWPGNSYRTISGTSMASPHVAGVAAAYISLNPTATPDSVRNFIISQTTKDVIDMECTETLCNSTPNRLLHLVCE